jgi:hypothetical protein
VLIEIGIATEIDIGSIGDNLDNDPDPDPDPDFDQGRGAGWKWAFGAVTVPFKATPPRRPQ